MMDLQRAVKLWPTPHGFSKDGRSNGPSGKELGRAVNQSLLPTPRASDAERGGRGDLIQAVRGNPNSHYTLPTPTSSRRSGLQSHEVNAVSGSLNPTWVEGLMGYPLGWTDVSEEG